MTDATIIQWLITGLIALVNIGGGFLFKSILDSIQDSKDSSKELAVKVHDIERMIVGEYMPRAEHDNKFETFSRAIFSKLDKIEDKIDKKADRM
jgi:hypothetical protein